MEPLVNAIYFDTSILRQQPFHELRRSLRPLLENARQRFPFDAWVPELALREWTAQLATVLDERSSGMNKAARELRKYDAAFRLEYAPPWAASSTVHARGILEAQIQDAGLNVVPTPEIALNTLLEMSIAKTPPFDAAGRGFRDAVILETIIQHARGRYESVLLLAADKDFADTALAASSTNSGVLIRRARDVQHAVGLINEKFVESLRGMIQAAQVELLALLRHEREAVVQGLRRSLQPSEELLKGGAQGADGGFFWALHRIDRILGYRFGEFAAGNDFPPLLGLLSDDAERIAVEMKVKVDFDLLVSAPTSIDKPRYSLPDSGDEARPPNQFGWNTHEMSVSRDVSFVASFTRDAEGNLDDLRLEQCDGKRVEPAV